MLHVTENGDYTITCPHCHRQWYPLDTDTASDRRNWGVIGGFSSDDVRIWGSPVQGDRCYWCAPDVSAKRVDETALQYLSEHRKAFFEVIRTYTERGTLDQDTEYRRMILDLLLPDSDFKESCAITLEDEANFAEAARKGWE